MTVLRFNRVCQLSLACNGSQHISLKEYKNPLVNKLTVILHRIVPHNCLRDIKLNLEEIHCN